MKKLIPLIFVGLTLLGCNSLPKVKPYNMKTVEFGKEKNGHEYIINGYDTNGDGYEDVKFYYIVREFADEEKGMAYLSCYAEDLNKDYQITEDEWTKFYRKWWMR